MQRESMDDKSAGAFHFNITLLNGVCVLLYCEFLLPPLPSEAKLRPALYRCPRTSLND